MPAPDPVAALAGGATVVTPRSRIARTLIGRHDAAMARANKRAWTAARALSWSTWVQTLWREALEAGQAPPDRRLLSAAEAHYLWQRLVRADPAVIDVGGTASLAAQAWQLMHAHGAGGESWRAWRDADGERSDAGAFARWAERYLRELAALAAFDDATLADAVREWAPRMREWRGRSVLLAGFSELSAQQQRLCAALRAAGMKIAAAPVPHENAKLWRASPGTPRDELRAALTWARAQAEVAPERFIGIAVPDLATRRGDVRALADDVLCPALQMPGQACATRPYAIAVSEPLADLPMVAAALAFVALAHGALTRGDAASLARSPYWSGPWVERAGCERAWIEAGRGTVAWSDFAAAMPRSTAVQLRTAIDGYSLRAQAPGAWVAQWRALLTACGWPAGADAQGTGYQARQAWERALDAFAQIGHVEPTVAASEAPAILRDIARHTAFHAETAPVAIVVVPIADAAALAFDALWVSGLTAQRWPPAPQPNPLLPLAWQRDRGVPRATPERELAQARLATQRLCGAAPVVVMSAPAAMEDYESAPSALIDARWPLLDSGAVIEDSARRIARTKDIEAVRDDYAPPYAQPSAPGGAGTIDDQSTCPFRAMARRRLAVQPWPDGYEALSYAERGQLVHAAMAAFWRDLRTHAALAALDATGVEQRVRDAAHKARGELSHDRWQALPPVIAASEAARIVGIAMEWIGKCERPRPPFEVALVE
ncbi:MAG: PD-(D/E)XK nuclease family protein, partial [Burkholderiales bacterium]|nr:PD-(D/E)XK nuclease family protein [Burkholderiales bacterium]